MRYTEKELFQFMDAGSAVRVTCTDGQVFTGPCWAHGSVVSAEEFGKAEPSLEVGCETVLFASEIEKIEVVDS